MNPATFPKTYLIEYEYQGLKWLIEVPAKSEQEAQERIVQIAKGAVLGFAERVVGWEEREFLEGCYGEE